MVVFGVGKNVDLNLNEEQAVMVDQLGAVTDGIQKHHRRLFVEEEDG